MDFSKSPYGVLYHPKAVPFWLDKHTWHYFGRGVSISGRYVMVGASYDDDRGDDSGAAYIFRRMGST